jgi:hypothetical protein
MINDHELYSNLHSAGGRHLTTCVDCSSCLAYSSVVGRKYYDSRLTVVFLKEHHV